MSLIIEKYEDPSKSKNERDELEDLMDLIGDMEEKKEPKEPEELPIVEPPPVLIKTPLPILTEQKRNLTEDEILDILASISLPKSFLTEVAKKSVFVTRERFYRQLKTITIYPSKLEQLKDMIISDYEKSIIEAGTSVGIPCAHSVAQPATQMSLSSFHSTGSVHVGLMGLPRFDELLNVSKNPKFIKTTIHFKEQVPSIAFIRENYQIQEVTFGSLVQSYTYAITTGSSSSIDLGEPWWYKPFEKMYSSDFRTKKCKILFKLNLEKLYLSRLTMLDIAKKLEENLGDIFCVFSPLQLGEFHIYIDTTNITSNYKEEDIYRIFILNVAIPEIKSILLCGVKGVKNININKTKTSYTVDTFNGDYLEILALPFVDTTKTVTDNAWDTYRAFGIEAARNSLINEFNKVLTADGSYIHFHHINLLVDVIIKNGYFEAITRYGMDRSESGVIAKASFEETQKNFMLAGIFGENDELNGVSACIATGKLSKIGSGMTDLIMRPLPPSQSAVDTSGRKKPFPPTPLTVDIKDFKNRICGDNVFESFFNTELDSPVTGGSVGSSGSIDSVGSVDFD